jgi:hypothetical protein
MSPIELEGGWTPAVAASLALDAIACLIQSSGIDWGLAGDAAAAEDERLNNRTRTGGMSFLRRIMVVG